METTQSSNNNNWAIPIAIVLAGGLVAASVYWTRAEPNNQNTDDTPTEFDKAAEKAVKVSDKDHVRGNRDADVKVITYTDFECPFCKVFHDTVNEALAEYGDNVAWVYRNFPIKGIHPKAVTEAVAAECVAELAGEDAYWKFVDKFFELTPSNNQTDLAILPQIAAGLGVNEAEFKECVASEKYTELINEHFEQAIQTGANGTPWSLVVSKSGRILSINGAQDYSIVKQILNSALAE